MNETAIEIKKFKDNDVRIVDQQGNTWFVLKDVLAAMESSTRPADAKAAIVDVFGDGVVNCYPIVDSLGRTQNITIINETATTYLISRSNTEVGKQLNKWLHSEVLPSIRKHGAYMDTATIEKTLNDPDFIIGLAQQLKSEQTKRRELESKVEQDKPLVEFAGHIANSNADILLGDFAKLMTKKNVKVGQNRLFAWMRDNGYMFQDAHKSNRPYQRYLDAGYFTCSESLVATNHGTIVKVTTKLTGKGQAFFAGKLVAAFGKVEAA